MVETKLKKAFSVGLEKLQLQDDCNEKFIRPTDESIIDCYEAIEAELGDSAEFYALQITLDAFWAFIHKLGKEAAVNNYSEYASYSGAQQLEPLSDALMKISIKKSDISLEAVYGDEIQDSGFVVINPLDPHCEVLDRRDITLRSLVDEVIFSKILSLDDNCIFDDAIPDLINLKKLFQDQVDYIDSKIEDAKKNPA